jgi:hypothetical protein
MRACRALLKTVPTIDINATDLNDLGIRNSLSSELGIKWTPMKEDEI